MTGASTVSEQLADFGVRARAGDTPPEVRRSVEQRLLDTLGLQAAAVRLPTSHAALTFVRELGGAPQAHVVGLADALPAPWAAFANGVLAHSLDFDDTHLPSIVHPSASVIPAVLAAGDFADASVARLVNAAAVGIEVVVRLGMAGYDRSAKTSIYFEHGQHATSICGAVGAATAAALLLDGDQEVIVDAIGVAVSMASGVIEANRTGGTVKRLHCGWAAHAGVTAAMLVAKGFTGPPTAIEGRFGLLEAFLHGGGSVDEITSGLGVDWALPGIFFKPYPANHFTHTAFDAARALRDRENLRPDDIEDVVLGVATSTVRTIGEPLELKRRPETGYQAQFSGPYMVALGFLGRDDAGLADFTDEAARDEERRSFMGRISIEGDARCDDIYPEQFPAILRVHTRDGRWLEEQVLTNRGGRDRPMSDEELRTKFRDNVRPSFPMAASDVVAMVEAVAAGDTDLRCHDLLEPLRRTRDAPE